METIIIPEKLKLNNIYRVYFDKNSGDIFSITNTCLSGNWFETDYESVRYLLDGSKRIIDYKVVYNTRAFEYEIISKNQKLIDITVDDLIYKVTFTKDSQIKILQNNKQKKWIVSMSKKMKSILKEKGARLEERLFFSVTEKDNPNILYRTFSVQIRDLVKNQNCMFDFVSQKEYEIDKIGVYTNRKFESYSYEVINE